MENNTDSRRVRMTKRILKDSMLELMEQKSINRITIKEICDLADINRSTFYAHYDNQYELLDEIENDIVAATPRINLYHEEPVQAELQAFFAYLDKNKKVCKVLFQNSDSRGFQTKILDKLFGKTDEKPQWIRGFDINNKVHMKMYMSAFGGLALVERWVNGDFDCSSKELADALSGYIQG